MSGDAQEVTSGDVNVMLMEICSVREQTRDHEVHMEHVSAALVMTAVWWWWCV